MIEEHKLQLQGHARLLPALRPDGLVPDIEHTALLPLTLVSLLLLLGELVWPPAGVPASSWRLEAAIVLVLGFFLAPLPLAGDPHDEGGRVAFTVVLTLCATAALIRAMCSFGKAVHDKEE